jgi:hypothetical protein
MQTMHPALVSTVIAICIATLMVQAGLAKRRLVWRPRRVSRRRRQP